MSIILNDVQETILDEEMLKIKTDLEKGWITYLVEN